MDYAGKKDAWNGYNPDSYKFVIAEWERLNEEQKKKKAKEFEEKLRKRAENPNASSDDDDSDDDNVSEKGNDD